MATRLATGAEVIEIRGGRRGTVVASAGRVHVDDNAMTAYVAGQLSGQDQSAVRAHLDGCPECLELVVCAIKQRSASPVSPSRDDTSLALGSDRFAAERPQRRVSEPGAMVGPYVIERLLGAGGMGIVYAARDPRLDRLVALKLIRQQPGIGHAQLAERLRRESKALARLSHPHVTVVYELGAADDEIFIAMEYVAGTTLRAWLAEARREPREILATFRRAGEGLAAAHAAGLVHRDFKPDNVLLGSDGSVKVTDFGLARIASDALAREATDDEPVVDAESASDLTVTGAVVGTPAYMAPEQLGGAAVDARADQFAFCVALFEALFGQRPFAGTTLGELREAVLAERVELPRGRRVASRVRRALLRGLAASPARRFPSMDALLAALAPRRGRIMLGLAGTTVAATAALAASLVVHAAPPAPCGGADAEIDAVWNAGRRASMRQAFLATRAPGAAEAWTAVEHGIDAYLKAWGTMHGQSCEATQVHHQQSEAVMDLRTGCLERRRSEVDALLAVFEHADGDAVSHAREAVAALPELAVCADVEVLARRTPLPREPLARQRHDALRLRIGAAKASVDVAHYRDALPALTAILAEPALGEFPALEAEAQSIRGKALTAKGTYAEAEQALFRGLVRAQAARADELVSSIEVDLAHVVGYDAQRPADGLRWADQATAAIAAKGGDPLLAARLDTVRAGILQRQGKLAEAETIARRALAAASRLAPGSPLEAEALDMLGLMLAMEGRFDEAVPTLERAVAQTERFYGAMHFLSATVRMNLANALNATHRTDEALAQYRQALAVDEVLFGKHGVQVAQVLSNLGQMLQEQGKLAEAGAMLERALAIREEALGPADPAVARTAANLGYLRLDEHAYAQARELFARVGAILDKTLGADHPQRADDLAGLGLAWLGLGDTAKAVDALTRAVAVTERSEGDPVNLASVRAKLARALHDRDHGLDRARARSLAVAARAVLAEAGETSEVAELDAWLTADTRARPRHRAR